MSMDVLNSEPRPKTPLTSAAMWDALAPSWDARGEWHASTTRHITSRMVDLLAPQPTETIVELAGGPTADAAFEVLARQPDHAGVIASDFSAGMLEAARRRAQRRGVGSIEFRQLDATALELADSSVDGLLARWIYMLLPQPLAGFREARRVLRPGGRFVFAVFADAERNPFFMFAARVLIERGLLEPPHQGQPSMFALAEGGKVATLLNETGFERPHIEQLPLVYALRDEGELWSFVSEFLGPVSMILGRLGAQERQQLRSEIERRAEPYRDGSGFRLPGSVLVVATTARVSRAD